MKGTGLWWLPPGCRRFCRQAEEYLATHAGAVLPTPARLAEHLAQCTPCEQRWQAALRSRALLASLQERREAAGDPHFYTRLRARIHLRQADCNRMEVRWLHLALALALFVAALGSFAYNLHRTEIPDADEAMALDVPHINPQHPADSHVRPRLADAMLNLMNP